MTTEEWKRDYMATFVQDLPYDKTDKVAAMDKPLPIKPRIPAKLPPSVPARACTLSKTCALRKAGKCTPVNCADAYHFVANAEAHGRAVARTVQPLVGSSGVSK